jgi:hypothetical protein
VLTSAWTVRPAPFKFPPEQASVANLIPFADNFYIQTTAFSSTTPDVVDGCIQPGKHRILRFDFLVHNAGHRDLVLGSPAEQPELFVWSSGHDHYHIKDFNEYQLVDRYGMWVTSGSKQPFCLFDNRRITDWASRTRKFRRGDCNTNQGISAGWADLYNGDLVCQFIAIDRVQDGDYALLASTNTQRIVEEGDYQDNTACIGLRIRGNRVTRIPHRVCRVLASILADRETVPSHVVDFCNFKRPSMCESWAASLPSLVAGAPNKGQPHDF